MTSQFFTRAQYTAGQCDFRTFYGQFVNERITAYVVNHFKPAVLLASTDKHLNDIPLNRWDWMANSIPILVNLELWKKAHRDQNIWSLSDKVCIAKVAAHLWIASERANQAAKSSNKLVQDY